MIPSISQFKEYQRYKNKALVRTLLFLDSTLIIGITLGFRSNVYVLGCLGVVNLLIVGFLILILNTKLETIVDQLGVSVKWIPFQKSPKKIEWSNVSQVEVTDWFKVKHNFHIGSKYKHTVMGKEGLFIKLKNSGNVFIGTQRPDEIRFSIHNISF